MIRNKSVSKPIERVSPHYSSGLTHQEARERMEAGLHNLPIKSLTRSVPQIIFQNLFTLFNIINAVLSGLIIMVGSYKNLLFMGVVISNTLIGIIQELRAKRNIDKLSIITQSKVTSIRQGDRITLSQEQLVLDDIMFIANGNQVCADSKVVFTEGLEVDESQLTGESKPVSKTVNDTVMSGSIVVAGSAYVQITAVGTDNYVSKLSLEAKREKKPTSQLMRAINAIIKTLTFVILPLGIALFATQFTKGVSFETSVLGTTAAMVGMIPEGLVLLTGVAFAIGAINLARRKTLVQSLPCIETLARVDVLCLDKTGTITDGKLNVTQLIPMKNADEDISTLIADVIHNLNDNNPTAIALQNKFDQVSGRKAALKIPFSSARKWSGCQFENGDSYVVGAAEFVLDEIDTELNETINHYSSQGFRVLGFAKANGDLNSSESNNDLLALIIISDNIRPEAPHTFSFFKEQGVDVKVISGDNPVTVSNVAVRAGLSQAGNYIDMSAVGDNEPYEKLVEENTVFGRVSPFQKRKLVKALQKNGHIVAMTGDGVNDVLALKDADCSIAMAEGSDAARNVSDFVLLNSDFSSMINVVREGRRVVNNIERVAALYLVKTIFSVILTLIFIFLPLEFPFEPIQMTPASTLTVGIPSFFLALKPTYRRIRGRFIREVLRFALPGALCIIINLILIQIFAPMLGLNYDQTSTVSALMTGAFSFIVLYYVSRPLDFWRKLMIGLLMAAYLSVFLFFGSFFSLTSLFSETAYLYLPLIMVSLPLFRIISFLCLNVSRRIRRYQRKRAKKVYNRSTKQ